MNVFATIKAAADLAQKYKMMPLYNDILTLQESILSLREDNLRLREENSQLRDQVKNTAEVARFDNFYYKLSDENHKVPFCVTCWDHDHKLIGLTLSYDPMDGHVIYSCGICAAR